jgi:adenylylsulfate kinase
MNETKATNITWHHPEITKTDREKLLRQKGVLLWFTGLSASGKSTLAHAVEQKLFDLGHLSIVLDGDNIRHGLNKNLGFSPEDRHENIRRIGEVCKLMTLSGVITMAAFISPYRQDRSTVRELLAPGEFIEIFVDTPLDVLESRDPKGLYKKARKGEIKEFTGISAPYEAPINPEIYINTHQNDLQTCMGIVLDYMKQKGIICIYTPEG